MKRFWNALLLVLVAIAGLVGSTSARERIPFLVIHGDTLIAIRSAENDTWNMIGENVGLSVQVITHRNRILKPRPPYIGELVFLNSIPGVGFWNYQAGAPARGTVLEQIEVVNVSEEVKSLWRVQAETEAAVQDTVWSNPDNPLILGGITQHDARLNRDVAKGTTICKWVDDRGQPIYYMLAEIWDPVIYDGKFWQLMHFTVCNNIGFPLPTSVPEPPPPPPIAAVEPPAPPPPPAPEPDTVVTVEAPPETTVVPPIEHKPSGWPLLGVVWGTGERVDMFDSQRHQWNGYAGIELAAQLPFAPRLEVVGRFSPNVFGSTNFTNGTATYNTRLGLRYYLGAVTQTRPIPRAPQYTYQRTLLEAKLEAGLWGDRQDVLFVEKSLPEINRVHFEERTTPFYGVGPYARLMAQSLGTTYLEAFGRFGSSISSDLSINVITEPGRLYLYGAAGTQKNKQQQKEVHGQKIVSPWSTFTAREVRLGFKPVLNHILFASYSDWRFDSKVWSFIHHGPGIGWEWRIGPQWRAVPPWRFTVHVRTFHDADTDKIAHETSTGRELRESATLTYSF